MKSERVGRFRKLADREFKTDGPMKGKEGSPTDFRFCFEILKSFTLENRGVRDVCYLQSEAERGERSAPAK